jgi:hypothetical protein
VEPDASDRRSGSKPVKELLKIILFWVGIWAIVYLPARLIFEIFGGGGVVWYVIFWMGAFLVWAWGRGGGGGTSDTSGDY